jgi:hypothetical protein
MSNTCAGCQHNRGGRCRAHAPAPRTDGQPADRAEWPPHDGQGCGEYAAPEPEPQRTGKMPAGRREKLGA